MSSKKSSTKATIAAGAFACSRRPVWRELLKGGSQNLFLGNLPLTIHGDYAPLLAKGLKWGGPKSLVGSLRLPNRLPADHRLCRICERLGVGLEAKLLGARPRAEPHLTENV